MMTNQLQFRKWPAFSVLLTFFWCCIFTTAQSATAQTPPQDHDNVRSAEDRDTTRHELASFDQFLDSHRETAEQLRKDPSLVDNQQFLKDHPALETYLKDHPAVRQELRENPNGFMKEEDRFDRHEDDRDRDANRPELANFDRFLDSHRETAEQLRKDPSLVDNQQFLKDHPALETYLKDHPAVRQELRENPNAFMKEEDRFDRHEDDRDRDANRRELANFDRFLDNHREIAEQLRKDPSLVDNQKFLNDHPVLQSYLKDHPGVRQELRENPNAFMQEEARYDRREDAMNREGGGDHDFDHSHSANFGEFLGAHANIAQDLSKDPSLAKSQDYLQDHPELQDYLNSHPEVRQDLQADPQNFLKSAQQFNNNGQGIKPPTAPTADSKPKQ